MRETLICLGILLLMALAGSFVGYAFGRADGNEAGKRSINVPAVPRCLWYGSDAERVMRRQ